MATTACRWSSTAGWSGVVTRVDVLRGARRRGVAAWSAALATVDRGRDRAQLRAAARRAGSRRAAVRGRQGRRLRPRRARGGGGRAGRRRELAVRGDRRGGRASCGEQAGARRRHGRAHARGARGRARRRRRDRRLGRALRGRACRPVRACTSSSTPAWGGWARATPRRRLRVADQAVAQRLRAGRADDPLRHRRRARRRVLRRAARALPRAGPSRCASATRARCCTPPTAPATLRDAGRALRPRPLRRRDLRPRPVPGRSGRRSGLEPALALRLLRRGGQAAARPGRAPATGGASSPSATDRIATVPIGYGDGWRRGLTNNAEVLIDGPPLPAGRHGQHGQRHRRPRRRRRTLATSRCSSVTLVGEGITRRGGRPAAGHDQLRGHLRR